MSTTLWSSDKLADHEFPEPAYLVEPMIPLGGIAVLHGKPNVGKTQLVLTMAHAINNGLPLFGRWPTRPGPVVVVQADMTGQIQQLRIRKIVEDIDISETYWVVEEDGSTPMIDIVSMAATKQRVVKEIRTLDPVLVVWDTLRKIHRLPENASETPITVYGHAKELFPTATHLFVHHDRKESRDPDLSGPEDEAFMGNVQWKGASDTTFQLEEISTPPKRVTLTFHKARTAPDTEKAPFLLELDMKTMLLLPVRARRREGLEELSPRQLVDQSLAARIEAERVSGTSLREAGSR